LVLGEVEHRAILSDGTTARPRTPEEQENAHVNMKNQTTRERSEQTELKNEAGC
jgi:hypothetical protein